MNEFGFNIDDVIVATFQMFLYGLAFGFIVLGIIRYLLLGVFERKE
jgi:hypothetical protein